MRRNRKGPHGTGFTLVEVLVALTLIGIAAGMAYPSLQQMIHRGKIEGFARNAVLVMRETRLEAVKRGVPCVVQADLVAGDLISYADVNGDGIFNPDPAEPDFRSTDYQITRLPLPVGVSFEAPAAQLAIQGFSVVAALPERVAIFQENGSIDELGAYRIGDERGNFLEVQVAPAATAKVGIRKWDGTDWLYQGEEGGVWEWQ